MKVFVPHVKSHWDCLDLRFTLRSIAKHFPSGEPCLVGSKPEWYQGEWLDYEPPHPLGMPFMATMEKLYWVAERTEEDFLFWDDDVLALSPYSPAHYHRDGVKTYAPGPYRRAWQATEAALGNDSVKDFEMHVPMWYEPARVLAVRTQEPLCFRTWYGNKHRLESVALVDQKFPHYRDGMPSSGIISTGDMFLGTEQGKGWAQRMLPEKSPWE